MLVTCQPEMAPSLEMYGYVLQMCYVSLQYFIIKGAIPSLNKVWLRSRQWSALLHYIYHKYITYHSVEGHRWLVNWVTKTHPPFTPVENCQAAFKLQCTKLLFCHHLGRENGNYGQNHTIKDRLCDSVFDCSVFSRAWNRGESACEMGIHRSGYAYLDWHLGKR